jgi:predicted phage terminase large subunit-like protein
MTTHTPRDLFNAALRTDFQAFFERAFMTLNPTETFHDNWSLQAIAHHLNLCASRKIKRLLILVTPRSSKSTMASVAFPAYLLGRDPSTKIIAVSYSSDLSTDLSNKTRSVMKSDWYRETFPHTEISKYKDTQSQFETTAQGVRYATSIEGPLTGLGSDFIIIDDPLKANEANSENARKKVNEWFNSTVLTRLNNPMEGVIIVVMQRLHVDDLAGHLIGQGGWTVLQIPARAETDTVYHLGNGKTYTYKAGELLHPARLGQKELDELRNNMGTAAFYAQYQQQPIPPSGNLFDWKWFKTYETTPEFSELFMSVDVAGTENGGNYTAVTIWGHRDRRWFFCAAHRFRFDLPKVRQMICKLDQDYQPDLIVIDEVGLGRGLKQELIYQGFKHVVGAKGKGKVVDAEEIAPMIEAGRVLVPHTAPGLSEFRDEIIRFPNGKHCDQVDSMVQLLRRGGVAVNRAQAHKRPERKNVRSKPNQLNAKVILIEAGRRRLFSYS